MSRLSYYRSDELPHWQATIQINGTGPDFSSGWTFEVKVGTLTKTTNITGAASGVITVAWAASDLDQTPNTYTAQLVATRTSDSAQCTVTELLEIKARS